MSPRALRRTESNETCIREKLHSPAYSDQELCKCRECEMSRPVTGRTADASTVAIAAVWPSSVMNSISKALPSERACGSGAFVVYTSGIYPEEAP